MENTGWEYCRENFGAGCTGRECIDKTEEILDFANMVFSVAYGSTDFATLLPKAYSHGRSGIPVHYMIRDGNRRIRALADMYPVNLCLQGKGSMLRAAYVGTVAVHPNARGRGCMTELMRRAEEDARRHGCALMILDGERHRYQHYGFERAGIRCVFQVGTDNIRHCCARMDQKEYMESPVFHYEELREDSPYLDRLYGLYQQRLVTARSRGDFLPCLQSYNASAYAVLRDGEAVGYVNLSEGGESVLELEIARNADGKNTGNGIICRVLHDLMLEFGMEQVRVSVGMDEQDKIAGLEKACDSCSMAMSHQIRILDYEPVLGFLLEWKQKYAPLAIGDYVLGVRDGQTGHIEKYLLSVAVDGISVSRTGAAADTVLEKLEMVRLLTTSLCYAEQQKGVQNKIKNAPAGWFPLPFYLPEADTF